MAQSQLASNATLHLVKGIPQDSSHSFVNAAFSSDMLGIRVGMLEFFFGTGMSSGRGQSGCVTFLYIEFTRPQF